MTGKSLMELTHHLYSWSQKLISTSILFSIEHTGDRGKCPVNGELFSRTSERTSIWARFVSFIQIVKCIHHTSVNIRCERLTYIFETNIVDCAQFTRCTVYNLVFNICLIGTSRWHFYISVNSIPINWGHCMVT